MDASLSPEGNQTTVFVLFIDERIPPETDQPDLSNGGTAARTRVPDRETLITPPPRTT